MAKNNAKKRKIIKKADSINATPSKIDKKQNNNKKQQKIPKSNNPTRPDSDSDSDQPAPVKLQNLLEPYSKDQLLTLAVDTAIAHPSFYNLINSAADNDITHRKIFIYGLARETTRQTLISVFEQFGEVEECNVVMDHNTGKAKGYAFVVFKSRKSADKALKKPQMTINGRVATCKLAAVKDTAVNGTMEFGNRKIYVSNVPRDVAPEKLRLFFENFGEIEAGPMGFDPTTGKSKGYALFLYKTVEEAKRCLEEPCKVFDGRKLYCKKAAEPKIGGGEASITTEVIQHPLLAMPPSVAAAQNMGMMGQDPNLAMMNQLYGRMVVNPYVGFLNPFVGVYGGMLGSLGGGASGLGVYGGGVGGSSIGGSSGGVAPGLMQAYPNKQVGQPSPAKLPGTSGYSSHL
ncbi:UBP1-associated protein 2A [Nicotiana tabacum]|uniref:UBP1-associated protein 2A n=2 Tax=Nicotiana TaxID=4085 RepID=A0A1S4B2A6_TOBAC|nr:PREDICTED: UBP1-associated protein 2A-like [Nicotiana sylvestris]XP_016482923.1 PREDICTED: UBP1-associated protein 2A-like [Nicotiana tabacum]